MIEPSTPSEVPPGGWRWRHLETGHVVVGGTYEELLRAVRLFLGNNNYPIPREIGQEVLRALDEEIQEDMHKRGLPVYPLVKTTEKPSVSQMARNFAYAATGWALSGFKHVSQEVYEFRLERCEGCHFWQGQSAFGYGRCGKCGCSGLKLFMASTRCPLDPPRWTAI